MKWSILFWIIVVNLCKDFAAETTTMYFHLIYYIFVSDALVIIISAAFRPTGILKCVVLAFVLFSKTIFMSEIDKQTSQTMFSCLFY